MLDYEVRYCRIAQALEQRGDDVRMWDVCPIWIQGETFDRLCTRCGGTGTTIPSQEECFNRVMKALELNLGL